MISYITEMPPEDCDHARGHKMPFLANQIFTDGGDGVSPIIEQFFFSKCLPKDNSAILAQKEKERHEKEQIIKRGFKNRKGKTDEV